MKAAGVGQKDKRREGVEANPSGNNRQCSELGFPFRLHSGPEGELSVILNQEAIADPKVTPRVCLWLKAAPR